jgi:hypothetical protein
MPWSQRQQLEHYQSHSCEEKAVVNELFYFTRGRMANKDEGKESIAEDGNLTWILLGRCVSSVLPPQAKEHTS